MPSPLASSSPSSYSDYPICVQSDENYPMKWIEGFSGLSATFQPHHHANDQAQCPCAKAKVLATMAIQYIEYGDSLNESGKVWQCPFNSCKELRYNIKDLIDHVKLCDRSGSDQTWCNSCNGRECFFTPNANSHCCGNDVSRSTKVANGMRRLSNFVQGMRPSSRQSNRSSVSYENCNVSLSRSTPAPSSAFVRSPNCMSEAFRTQRCPPTGTLSLPVAGTQNFGSRHELADTGRLELGDSSVLCELPSQPTLAVKPTHFLDDAQMFTASPEEDMAINDKLPAYGAAYSTEVSTSPFDVHQASAASFGEYGTDHSSLGSGTYGSGSSRSSFPESMVTNDFHSTTIAQHGNIPNYSYTSIQNSASNSSPISDISLGQDSVTQTGTISSSFQFAHVSPTESHRQPGDAHLTEANLNGLTPWTYRTSHWKPPSTHFVSSSESATISPVTDDMMEHTSSSSGSAADKGRLRCFRYPVCTFQPSGKPGNLSTYLKKHEDTHRAVGKECPDCGKRIKRSDNLKAHQRDACKAKNPKAPSRKRKLLAGRRMGPRMTDGNTAQGPRMLDRYRASSYRSDALADGGRAPL